MTSERKVVGWREWISLPDLGLPTIKAKVDTGARTSSLHAWDIHEFTRRGRRMVRFSVHPEQRRSTPEIVAEAPLRERRGVRPSTGDREVRPVIFTTVGLLDEEWEIELTLTNRDAMGFRMLLGRQALRGRFVVDPATSFRNGKRAKGTRRLKKPRPTKKRRKRR